MSERSKRTMDTAALLAHGDCPDPATEAFLAHRNLLFTVAYEMLGSAADAEDVLQETWLRWAGVDLGTVRDQRAYLVRITTRQALTRLRVAEAVGKSPAAVRQIAHRARAHVGAHRPRGVISPKETRAALDAFQRAAETGDLQSLLDILAPDVVFLGDGGGVKQAVLRPVVGAGQVARLLAAGLGRITAAASLQVNGYPALILRLDGEIDTVVAVRIDDGLITGLYAIRNPEKLSHMHRETALRR